MFNFHPNSKSKQSVWNTWLLTWAPTVMNDTIRYLTDKTRLWQICTSMWRQKQLKTVLLYLHCCLVHHSNWSTSCMHYSSHFDRLNLYLESLLFTMKKYSQLFFQIYFSPNKICSRFFVSKLSHTHRKKTRSTRMTTVRVD